MSTAIIQAIDSLLPEIAAKLNYGKEFYGTEREKEFIDTNFPTCPQRYPSITEYGKADNVFCFVGRFRLVRT
jgi:mannose-1-phosphate guanylyltransferase